MAALSPEQKLLVVTRLACFVPATEIQAELKEAGVETSLPQISFYDPLTANGRELSEELRCLFFETRTRFLDEIASIPIADRRYRLLRLQRLLDHAKYQTNVKVALAILEQAAKESGGAYTNRKELTGADGGPIQVEHVDLTKLNDEELAELERLLSRAEASEPSGSESGAGAAAGPDVP